MLRGSHVKRSRYLHQVSCAAVYILLTDAFANKDMPFQEWLEEKRQLSVQFHYWLTVIELEALLLMLVRSLRESNFEMFLNALDEIAPWMFALDHTNYSRWLPIFIQDIKKLKSKHPHVYNQFQKGHFTSK